jgi:hypothetical protein
MSTSSFHVPGDVGPLSQRAVEAPILRASLVSHVGLTVLTLSAICLVGPQLGFVLSIRAAAILAAGAIAVELAPGRKWELTVIFGALLLARYHPVHTIYCVALVGALYLCRRQSLALAVVAGVFALAVPKTLFSLLYHRPAWYEWLNEPNLSAVILITAYWWREARSGRLPVTRSSPLVGWWLLFFFPTHAVNPIVFGPGDLWRERRVDHGAVFRGVALFAAKAAAFAALKDLFPGHGFAALSASALMGLSFAELWRVVALNYVDLVLLLSGTADIAIVLARLYGWNLPSPFRWALLAWNPVELWRRWSIYNRRFLLKTVYFPLGGAGSRRLLNVMLTFLASALVLHSGWFGSKYWEIGVAGWRDQSIYFLLQGSAVCACLVFWKVTAKDPSADRALRWSLSRGLATLATQMLSALVHVVILVQSVPLADRWKLMARCLGF